MENKNAYEIRLEVLNIAHEDVVNMYHEKMNILKNVTEKDIEKIYPTTDAIIKRAQRLYRFICEK